MTSNGRTRTVLFVTNLSHTPHGTFKYEGEQYRQFREAYRDLAGWLSGQNIDLYFTGLDHLRDDGTFSAMYQVHGWDDSMTLSKVAADPLPGVVVNRLKDMLYEHAGYEKLAEKVPVINEVSVALLGNKAESLKVLSDFLPQSIVVGDQSTDGRKAVVEKVLQEWGRVIVKPLRENGGRSIVLADNLKQLADVIADRQSYVVQKFIETGNGVPGLIAGRHDVRLYVVSSQIVAGSVRQPKEGGFLSNTSQGGEIMFLERADLPEELLDMAQQIIIKLGLPRASFISLDFFFGEDQWYLIEVNDQPGMPASYQHERVAATIHKALTAMYTEVINHD